jgi:hypothetical protein
MMTVRRKVDWPELIEELSESNVFAVGLTMFACVAVFIGVQIAGNAARNHRMSRTDPYGAQVAEFMRAVSNHSRGN